LTWVNKKKLLVTSLRKDHTVVITYHFCRGFYIIFYSARDIAFFPSETIDHHWLMLVEDEGCISSETIDYHWLRLVENERCIPSETIRPSLVEVG
jgi:hypothetical protein